MPKRYFIAFCCAFLFVVGPLGAGAQATLEINEKRVLKFGKWASDVDFSGTVTVSPNADTATGTGGALDFGGIVRRARFQLVGEPRAWVIVTLPSSMTIRKGTSGHTMTVDSFTMDISNPVRLNNKGKKTFNVGATLHIGANQKKGAYNDDNHFTIYADYQ